jgi:hypothetical protein
MAFEALVAENWLFDTLSTDQTLAEALATNGRAPFEQVGVYSHIAPLIDPRSGKPPVQPYVVFALAGTNATDDIALCGQRITADPIYRITVWDVAKGAVSWSRLQPVADRIDALVNNQTLNTTPPAWIRRLDGATEVEIADDGLIDFGITQTFVVRFKSAT